MIRLAVCDDQQEYAAQVETVIKRCFREQGIASEILRYTDSRMLIYDIQENEHFDIFCLDIEICLLYTSQPFGLRQFFQKDPYPAAMRRNDGRRV